MENMHLIQQTAFNFFNDYTNLKPNSKGYGLTLDHSQNKTKASIAATGFTLSSYIIAWQYNYLEKEEILYRVRNTLKTLYYNVDHYEGFFSHFISVKTGKRYKKSEYSTIDTALALNGILAVENFFKDKIITKYANLIFSRINFEILIHKREGKDCLYMAYNDLPNGDYIEGQPGFIHHWGMFAEQLMIYLFIAGSQRFNQKISLSLYNSFERKLGAYDDIKFIYSPGNALFVYLFPLAWLDLESIVDADNISWFENAKNAILAQVVWAKNQNTFKTFTDGIFGISASDTPKGYKVFQALPNVNGKTETDGTAVPSVMVGTLPFLPEIAKKSIDLLFNIENLWHHNYGFYDAFNFEKRRWISKKIYAINKGLEILMVNAYLTKDVQKSYMNHSIVLEGMKVLKWKKT